MRPKSTAAAQRAGDTIRQSVKVLGSHPKIGRLTEGLPETYREWLIDFGDSGYLARYRLDGNVVTILAIWHQKEAGYK